MLPRADTKRWRLAVSAFYETIWWLMSEGWAFKKLQELEASQLDMRKSGLARRRPRLDSLPQCRVIDEDRVRSPLHCPVPPFLACMAIFGYNVPGRIRSI